MCYLKSTHTRFYNRFHVVWAKKYRYKVLQNWMRERIREIIIQTCNEVGIHIMRDVLGSVDNHVEAMRTAARFQ